ncbi:hypothetical protein ACJ51O_35550 (plasmid) [Burkholderia pyrrocinia]|uniref:hypothetical protein n=1 Tax=Burkholderia pyrrocinia TaxID=60550 RepID=UPI0038B54262
MTLALLWTADAKVLLATLMIRLGGGPYADSRHADQGGSKWAGKYQSFHVAGDIVAWHIKAAS